MSLTRDFLCCIFKIQSSPMPRKPLNLLVTILWVGFLVGLLDISAALIQVKIIFPDRNPSGVLLYIASAVFGKQRAYSEDKMYLFGALFHFIIAYGFTIAFFLIYPHVRFLSKSRLLAAIGYGIFIWVVMNLLVVPQTKIGDHPIVLKNAAIAAGILIVVMGIPLSYLAYRFYYAGKSSLK